MTITRTDCPELKAVFPAWTFGRSSIDGRLWVKRAPGNGWLPLARAAGEAFAADLDAAWADDSLSCMERQARAGRVAARYRDILRTGPGAS